MSDLQLDNSEGDGTRVNDERAEAVRGQQGTDAGECPDAAKTAECTDQAECTQNGEPGSDEAADATGDEADVEANSDR